jgi:hypothetical protein
VILQEDVPDSCNDTCEISSHDSSQNITEGEESLDMEEAENPVPFVFPGMKPEHKVSYISLHVHSQADFTNIRNCQQSLFVSICLSVDMNRQASSECIVKNIFFKCLKRVLCICTLLAE